MFNKINIFISLLARKVSIYVGSSIAIALAFISIILWFAIGPIYHFSTDYQIVINTATTIITFLLVFLIQNTQNRDSHALHLKLDELIYSSRRARNHLMNLDKMTDNELKELQKEFDKLAERKNDELSISRARRSRQDRFQNYGDSGKSKD